jgi:hypothetical protein
MENRIDYYQFKQLLQTLENAESSIRFRLVGESWTEFSMVVLVSENAVMYQEGMIRRVIMNLRNVTEFQIDQPHLEYLPDYPYRIDRG